MVDCAVDDEETGSAGLSGWLTSSTLVYITATLEAFRSSTTTVVVSAVGKLSARRRLREENTIQT
jgi:hypothetical protein